MRLLHLADLHLGFRQYDRTNAAGLNQREVDVAATFTRVITKAIAIAPDLIVVAGDVFHAPRPGNPALVFAKQQVQRLTRELPNTLVIIVAGNHDLPRQTASGCALPLLEVGPNVYVVHDRARWLHFPERSLAVLCVPDIRGATRPPLVPDLGATTNVLVLHGEVQGMPGHAGQELIPAEEIGTAWSYVALGHYHVYRELGPRMGYSGSIDYTSTDSWGEMREEAATGVGKCIVEVDLETGARTRHPTEPKRIYLDLPVIHASDSALWFVARVRELNHKLVTTGTLTDAEVAEATAIDPVYYEMAAREVDAEEAASEVHHVAA